MLRLAWLKNLKIVKTRYLPALGYPHLCIQNSSALPSYFCSLTVFGASVTNLNEPPRALAYLHYNVGYELVSSLLGRCKQKQRGLRGLLCRWPFITEWEMYITVQGCRL